MRTGEVFPSQTSNCAVKQPATVTTWTVTSTGEVTDGCLGLTSRIQCLINERRQSLTELPFKNVRIEAKSI